MSAIVNDIVMLILSGVAIILSLYAVKTSRQSTKLVEKTMEKVGVIHSIVSGREAFIKAALPIYRQASKDCVIISISDTFGLDASYFEFIQSAEFAKKCQYIHYYGSFEKKFEIREEALLGAIVRKGLCPKIKIFQIDDISFEELKERFPFKFVMGKNSFLLGTSLVNQIPSNHGWLIKNLETPLQKFVLEKKSIKLEEYILKKLVKIEEGTSGTINPDTLKTSLFCKETITDFTTAYPMVGENDINKGLSCILKRIRSLKNV
jgi:hypothetical protein